jgi:hypothetical protein
MHEFGNWETEHYNSVSEQGRAVSILGIYKSEPDIYIGFLPALHLQCISVGSVSLQMVLYTQT